MSPTNNNQQNLNHSPTGSLVAGSVAGSPQVTHLTTSGTLDANLLGNPSPNNTTAAVTARSAPDVVTPTTRNVTPAAPQQVSIATAEQLAEYDDDL